MFSLNGEESSSAICRGCLSSDRRLAALSNYDLYFLLLNNKQTQEDFKYLNILLCWECIARLRSIEIFQARLQDAQIILSLAHVQKNSLLPLSTLQFNHKQGFDENIEENKIETKPDIEKLIDNCTDIDVKQELDVIKFDDLNDDHFNVNNDNFDGHDDNFNGNDDSFNGSDDKFYAKCKNKLKIKKKKCKKEKDVDKAPRGDGRHLNKVSNGFDFNNLDKYFTEVCLTEKEAVESLERERDDSNFICRPHKCSTCGIRFAYKTDLYSHKREFHKKRFFAIKCPACPSKHPTRIDLQEHWRRSHPVYRCDYCGDLVDRAKDRYAHFYRHKYRYPCNKCDVEFKDRILYTHHVAQLHSKYYCDYCGRSYVSKKSLETHILYQHLPNKCDICGRAFNSRTQMRRHMKMHPDGQGAYCVECDMAFPSRDKYTRHLSQAQRHRPRPKISVPCPECNKVFSRKQYMRNHVRLFHSNSSKHHCAICDKYFISGFSLRTHNKRVHEKLPMPKTKICSVCGRAFGTNRILENHMRTHTGERPFACARCGATFAQRVALRAHLAALHKDK